MVVAMLLLTILVLILCGVFVPIPMLSSLGHMRCIPGINISCAPWSAGPVPRLTEEPNPIVVEGQVVDIWDNNAAPGEIDGVAVATFRGLQYEFAVQSRDSNYLLVDVKVFQQMLHGFEYVGY
jgi:hypothetical protein